MVDMAYGDDGNMDHVARRRTGYGRHRLVPTW